MDEYSLVNKPKCAVADMSSVYWPGSPWSFHCLPLLWPLKSLLSRPE